MIPPWLPLRPDLPGRNEAIAAARTRLAREGVLAIGGAPGIGKTAFAGAVVAGSERALFALSLRGCEDAADAVRALGELLDVRPIGDEAALLDALRARRPVDLLVDDVASEAVMEPIHRAVAASEARLVVIGESPPLPDVYELGPLPDDVVGPLAPQVAPSTLDGNPLLARLAAALSTSVPEALERLGASAGLLAAIPVGLPSTGQRPTGFSLPGVASVPDRADRLLLRRGIAARLSPPPPPEAAVAALPAVQHLFALAQGAHPTTLFDPRDLLLLRWMARVLPSRADAARALAAASRLAVTAGQVQVARALLAEQLSSPHAPADAAILLWADGDALHAAGEIEDALSRWAGASTLLRKARATSLGATLHRRTGDRLAARGQLSLADAHFKQARQLYRTDDDPIGVAATLRGAADLAVCAGEWVSAGTLHEQVAATVDRVGNAGLERANLRLGEATLAIARGEYGPAERLLNALGALAADQPLLRANVTRRRADLLLRRGDHDGAIAAARQAAALYAGVGEATAQAAAVRLAGDAAAAAGRLAEAGDAYREALRLQVRVQDLRGLLRTLEHLAVVEEAAGRPEEARRRREQRAAVLGVAP